MMREYNMNSKDGFKNAVVTRLKTWPPLNTSYLEMPVLVMVRLGFAIWFVLMFYTLNMLGSLMFSRIVTCYSMC